MIINTSILQIANNSIHTFSNIFTFATCLTIMILTLIFLVFSSNIYIHDMKGSTSYQKYCVILCQNILTKIFGYNITNKTFNHVKIGSIITYVIITACVICFLCNTAQLILSIIIKNEEANSFEKLQSIISNIETNISTVDSIINTNNSIQQTNDQSQNIIQNKQQIVDNTLNGVNQNNQEYKIETINELSSLIQYMRSIPTFQNNDILGIIAQNEKNNKCIQNILFQSQTCDTNITNFNQSIELINKLSQSAYSIFNGIPKSYQLTNRINVLNNYSNNINIPIEMLSKIQEIDPSITNIQDIYNFLNYLLQVQFPNQLTNESLFQYIDRIYNEIQEAEISTLNKQIQIQSLKQQNALLKQLTQQYIQMFNNNFQPITSITEVTQIINNIIPQIIGIQSTNVMNFTSPSTSSQLLNYIKSIQQNSNIASIMNSYSKISSNINSINNTSTYNQYFNNLSNLINLLEVQDNNPLVQDNKEKSKKLANLLSSSLYGEYDNINNIVSNTINPSLHNINANIGKNTNIKTAKDIINNTTSTIKYAQANNIPLSKDEINDANMINSLIQINNNLSTIFGNLSNIQQGSDSSNILNSNLLSTLQSLSTLFANNSTDLTSSLNNIYTNINQISQTIQSIDPNNSNFNVYTNNIFSSIDATYHNTEPLLSASNTYSQNIADIITNNQIINSALISGNPWTQSNMESTNYQLEQYIMDIQNIGNTTINPQEVQATYSLYNQIYSSLQPMGSAFHKISNTNNLENNPNLYSNIQLLFNDFINSYKSIDTNLESIHINNDINKVLQKRYGNDPINTINVNDVNPANLTSNNFDFITLMNNANISFLQNSLMSYPVISYNNNQISNLLSNSNTTDNILDQWMQLTTLDKLLSIHHFSLFPSGTTGTTDAYTIMNTNNNYGENVAIAEHNISNNSRIANNILYNFYKVITNIPYSSLHNQSYNNSNLGSTIYSSWSNNNLTNLFTEGNQSLNSTFQYAKWKFYIKRLLTSKISDWFVNGYYSHSMNTVGNNNELIDLSKIPNIITKYSQGQTNLTSNNLGIIDKTSQLPIWLGGYRGHHMDNATVLNSLMTQEYIDIIQETDIYNDITDTQ